MNGNASLFNGSGAPPPGLAKSTNYAPFPTTANPQAASLSDPAIADTPQFLAKIEAALIEFLSKKPSQTDTLAKVGIYLRGRNLVPQEGLKKFIMTRPQLFIHLDDGKGGNRARLLISSSTNGGASSSFNDNNHHLQSSFTPEEVFTPPGIDENFLERQVVSYIYKNGTRENPVTVPELGEYCKKNLGFSMKGYLTRFLITRRQIFCLPDDGRQHVVLQPGAAEDLGIIESLPNLPDDLLGSGNEMLIHERPLEYGKWDRITQEMYDLTVSRGGSVPYKEVDVYIKARCAAEIAASGISLETWQAQKHSWKRRNVFKKEGNCLVLHSSIAFSNGKRGNLSNNGAAAAFGNGGVNGGGGNSREHEEEAFPPLNATRGMSQNATLQAFITERKALERLQHEVQRSLANLKSLSEIQKENSGLRAACVTLGRELLAVKDEISDLKLQLVEHGINLNNSINLNSPGSGGGLLDEIFLPSDLL